MHTRNVWWLPVSEVSPAIRTRYLALVWFGVFVWIACIYLCVSVCRASSYFVPILIARSKTLSRSVDRSVCWGTHSMHSLSIRCCCYISLLYISTHPIWIRVSVLRSCMRVGYVFVYRIYINISSFIHDIGFYLFTLVFWLGLLFFYFKLLFSLLVSRVCCDLATNFRSFVSCYVVFLLIFF